MDKKTIIIIAVVIVGIFIGGIFLLSGSSEEVANLTLSEDIDDSFSPIGETTEFEFDLSNQSDEDLVFLTGDMVSPQPDSELYTIWYGPNGDVIWNFEDDSFGRSFWEGQVQGDADTRDYEYDVSWQLGPPDHEWEEGNHRIEVILNGDVVETLEFEVIDSNENQEDQQGSGGSVEVTDLTLSKGVDGFEPVNETTVFEDSDTVYLTGVVQDPEVGMELYTNWYDEDGELVYTFEDGPIVLEEMHVGDNTPIKFHVGPPTVDWSLGSHSVELIIDGENIATLRFEIE